MYRKPRFLEELHAIREEMARESDYDVDLFAEMIRSGRRPPQSPAVIIRGRRLFAPTPDDCLSHEATSSDSDCSRGIL